MVAKQHYRWDFVGLSTDNKPTPETSEKVVNGSTYYCSDTSKLYVFCDGTWYERKSLGGGGGGGTSYTAGTGIDITNDTISVDTQTIQEKLTAGSNVSITNNTISATDTTYTAGSGISISGNVISATGGGGNSEFTILTDADADYTDPDSGDEYIALWNLDSGKYVLSPDATVGIALNLAKDDSDPNNPVYWVEDILDAISQCTILIHSDSTSVMATVLSINSNQNQNIQVAYGNDPNFYEGQLFSRRYMGDTFIASDGINDGFEGLVPAPTPNDDNKFLKSDGTWSTVSGGGPTVVQNTGTSTTDVMSQNAITNMIAPRNSNDALWINNTKGLTTFPATLPNYSVTINPTTSGTGGGGAVATGAIAINGTASGHSAISIGINSSATQRGSIALGRGASATSVGEMNIGTNDTTAGYNSTNYRLLSGVHDGQNSNDAVTVGQVNATIDAINTALSTNIPHIGATS